VTLISQSEGDAVVPTWFQGINPHLAVAQADDAVVWRPSFESGLSLCVSLCTRVRVESDREH
jgi:hypothetical protein